jgi:hypothetical protein
MKKHIVLLVATASAALVACQIQAGGTGGAQSPTPATPAAPAAPGAPAAIPSPTPVAPSARVLNMRTAFPGALVKPPRMVGRNKPPGTPDAPGTVTPPTTPPSGEPPVIVGPTPFGGGDAKEANFLGSVYEIPADSQKLPDLAALKPMATLFAKELNVPTRQFTEGFPGVAKRTEWFAIRFEAPLTVETEGDYDLTTNSDDGSNVYVDDLKIVDNDGVHPTTEKTGPVHLQKGTHSLRVEWYQGPGTELALQFYCNKRGAAKAICSGKL